MPAPCGYRLARAGPSESGTRVPRAPAVAGARSIECRPQDRLLVTGYIEGRTFGAPDVAAAENIPRIAAACHRLHEGALFGNDFDMFEIQRRHPSVTPAPCVTVPHAPEAASPQFHPAAEAPDPRAGGSGP